MKLYPIIVNDIDACLDPHKFEAYRKEDVDKALEEKDAKIKELEAEIERLNAELNAYHDLINRIDYCYLQIDGSYGDMKKGGLAYCVADKVKYIRRKGWINQPTTEENG